MVKIFICRFWWDRWAWN